MVERKYVDYAAIPAWHERDYGDAPNEPPLGVGLTALHIALVLFIAGPWWLGVLHLLGLLS